MLKHLLLAVACSSTFIFGILLLFFVVVLLYKPKVIWFYPSVFSLLYLWPHHIRNGITSGECTMKTYLIFRIFLNFRDLQSSNMKSPTLWGHSIALLHFNTLHSVQVLDFISLPPPPHSELVNSKVYYL